MRISLVAANWKMNGNRTFAERFFTDLELESVSADVVVCPPFPYLSLAARAAEEKGSFAVGGQNLSHELDGAFTGEVSAHMLLDCNVRYVIVGHSERRSFYHETSELVAKKFVAAQAVNLIPILCVGETLQERDQGHTLEVVASQLQAVKAVIEEDAWKRSVVAYEPVWAIGTGKTASPEEAQSVHKFIRTQLGDVGSKVQILYGGSVKSANASALFAQADIDGALVGGASLDAREFAGICRAAV
ncbi:triose-phosphate isomerase [Microbulbifer sp. 2205BS26-8]|uniref:triose-phosphate isomerase n=1 Tax=Microbulbifer sp. 2205BS26-8 TaxID=3064386 RepID=UPI00273E7F9D|nr:triose-phosphate isomerase [Microbulbifer sp. 2205BS26-8]MDP5210374.1 triose-phosphate isomerase [Microbulbifer sp. 2205BS26-8]